MFVLDIIESALLNSTYLQTSLKTRAQKAASTIYTCGASEQPGHVSIVRESSSESSTLASAEASAPFSPSPSPEAVMSLRTLVPSSLVAVSPC